MKAYVFCLLWVFCCLAQSGAVSAQRFLALTPHACEMLYAIGAGEQVVGAVSYCDYPEQAKTLPQVGNYQRVNVEAALRLNPDVAVVMSRQVKGVQQLEQLGVTIIVSNPSNFSMIFDDLLKLGKLTNHEQEAQALVAQLRTRLQHVQQQKSTHMPVFYEIWHDPLITAGGVSFISDLITQAGGENVFSNINLDTPHVNVEAVIRAKPQLIVIPQENRDVSARQLFWQKWLGKDHVRFVTIDPDLLHRPGPRLLDGLELLQQALQQYAQD